MTADAKLVGRLLAHAANMWAHSRDEQAELVRQAAAALEEAQKGVVRRDDDLIVPQALWDELDATALAWKARAEKAESELAALREWQPIETAPKDGTEILGWRRDCGILLILWTAPAYFMTTIEMEAAATDDDAWMDVEDWFCADIVAGSRLDGSEAPTHWRPLPAPPALLPADGEGA